MSEQVIKPMSVARADLINTLTRAINESLLPPFVVEAILKDLYADVHLASVKQLEIDRQEFEKSLTSKERMTSSSERQ